MPSGVIALHSPQLGDSNEHERDDARFPIVFCARTLDDTTDQTVSDDHPARFGAATRELILEAGFVEEGTRHMALGALRINVHSLVTEVPATVTVANDTVYEFRVRNARMPNTAATADTETHAVSFVVSMPRALAEQISREPPPSDFDMPVPGDPLVTAPGSIVTRVRLLDGIHLPPRLFFALPAPANTTECPRRVWPLLLHLIHTTQLIFPGVRLATPESREWLYQVRDHPNDTNVRKHITRTAMLLGRVLTAWSAFGVTYTVDHTLGPRLQNSVACESMRGLTFSRTADHRGTVVADCEDVALATRHLLEQVQCILRAACTTTGSDITTVTGMQTVVRYVKTQFTHGEWRDETVATAVAVATMACCYVPVCAIVQTKPSKTTGAAGVHAMTFAVPTSTALGLFGHEASDAMRTGMLDIGAHAPVLAIEGTNGICPVPSEWLKNVFTAAELRAFGSWIALLADNEPRQVTEIRTRVLSQLSVDTEHTLDVERRIIQTDALFDTDFYQTVHQMYAVLDVGDIVYECTINRSIHDFVNGTAPVADAVYRQHRVVIDGHHDEHRLLAWLARRLNPNTTLEAPTDGTRFRLDLTNKAPVAPTILLAIPAGAVGDGPEQISRVSDAHQRAGKRYSPSAVYRVNFVRKGDITATSQLMVIHVPTAANDRPPKTGSWRPRDTVASSWSVPRSVNQTRQRRRSPILVQYSTRDRISVG